MLKRDGETRAASQPLIAEYRIGRPSFRAPRSWCCCSLPCVDAPVGKHMNQTGHRACIDRTETGEAFTWRQKEWKNKHRTPQWFPSDLAADRWSPCAGVSPMRSGPAIGLHVRGKSHGRM